jgi:hypothetical protein
MTRSSRYFPPEIQPPRGPSKKKSGHQAVAQARWISTGPKGPDLDLG